MASTGEVDVDTSNLGQARAWDGDDGARWARYARRLDRAVAVHHRALLDAATIVDGERVLDVGCGSGQSTRDAARRAGRTGRATGVDLSARLLEVARSAADHERLSTVEFIRGDAQVHPFPVGGFDVVISRTGAMFFGDPPAAFGNIARALRRGGRLALLTWQPAERNEWFSTSFRTLSGRSALPSPAPGTPHPFSLAEPGHVEPLLLGAGFVDVALRPVVAPMHVGRDAADAQELLLGLMGWMLPADEPARGRALADFRSAVDAHTSSDGVHFGSAGWVVTARRGDDR